MQKTHFRLLACSIFSFTFVSCSNNDKSKSCDSWTGDYHYEEQPVKANTGYFMVMDWTLSITEKGDFCQGVLDVNGQQTYLKLLTNITGDTNGISIIYNSLIEGFHENLRKGDTLFVLTKNASKLNTKWFALEPRLSENSEKECSCFVQTK